MFKCVYQECMHVLTGTLQSRAWACLGAYHYYVNYHYYCTTRHVYSKRLRAAHTVLSPPILASQQPWEVD